MYNRADPPSFPRRRLMPDFSRGERHLFIDGKLVDARSGATYPNVNPATEESLGEVGDGVSLRAGRVILNSR